MAAFRQAIEAPGPRVAYAEGLARAVLCEVGYDMMEVALSQASEFAKIPKSGFPNVEKLLVKLLDAN